MKNKKYFLFFIIILILKYELNIVYYKKKYKYEVFYRNRTLNIGKNNGNKNKSYELNYRISKCFLLSDKFIKGIIHVVLTRFLFEFNAPVNFNKILSQKEYIYNGIRVMKKYLFPSLENQSCKQFKWILLLGDKANKTYIESLFKFNFSFEYIIIYRKFLKEYLRNMTKGFDILITTNIDYDDIIYYDAVNDVRKAININKPMILYGYNRGVYYFEKDNKYYEFYSTYGNKGAINIFDSLITVLNKVNDTYTIYDLGSHTKMRSNLLKFYKSFGIHSLLYEPAIFDSGDPKFVYVRQKFSHSYNYSKQKVKEAKTYNFNSSNLFGK